MSTETEVPRRMIGAKGAARLYDVHWRTWLRWCDGGLVPCGVRIGGRRLWDLDELAQHIKGGCQPVRKGV
jgi:hypothetical protein